MTDTVVRFVGAVRSMWRSGVSYAQNLTWIVRCGVVGRLWRAGSAFACGQLSLGAQVAALGVLYWYADKAQADAVVSLPMLGVAWSARQHAWLVWAVVTGSTGCFLASSWFRYLSRNMFVGLGERMLAERLTNIVDVARRLPDPRAPAASRSFVEHGLTAVTRGCRYASVSLVMLLEALTPMVGGIGAAIALCVIDPLLTAMLLAAAALWCVAIYPLMMRQVQVRARMTREKAAFARESRAALQTPLATDLPARLASAGALAQVVVGRRRLLNGISAVFESGTALMGGLAALYLASRLIAGDGDWPIFILYLGGLRVALTGGFAVPQVFGAVSRFYPDLVVFVEFMRDAARLEGVSLARVATGAPVRLGALPEGTALSVRGGDRIALASYDTPPTVAATFLRARTAEQPVAAAWWRPDDHAANDRADPVRDAAAIRLVTAEALAARPAADARAWLDAWRDGVTVIVHRDPDRVGRFGESQLLVAAAGAFAAVAQVGTGASRDALAAFAADRARVEAAAGAGPGSPRVGVSGPEHEEEEEA